MTQGHTQAAPNGDFDEIIYKISHDLMASVRAIKDLPDWVLEDLEEQGTVLPEESRSMLRLMQSHGRRMDAMIKGLLTYSRVGRLQDIGTLDTAEIVAQAIRSVDLGSGVRLKTRITPAPVRMGQVDLERLAGSLVSNAVQHHDGPNPFVAVASGAVNGAYELRVSDDGPGIPEGMRAAVFRPMSKLKSRDEDESGGMGLAIAAKIAAFYDGTIEILAPDGPRGTTVRVRLPLPEG